MLRFSIVGAGRNCAVNLLYGQALLIGIFYGTFDITAHSVFLSLFDEKMMARAYIFSGITGLILTFLYTKFSSGLRFNRLALLNLIFVSAVTFILWILLAIGRTEQVIPVVFIMAGPLNVLVMLGVAGTTFRLRKINTGVPFAKHTDTTIIFGIMAAGFLMPLLISTGMNIRHFLLISLLSLVSALIIQIYMGNRYLREVDDIRKPSKNQVQGQAILLMPVRNKFIRMTIFFVILSVITNFFVRYSFLASARIQYPSAEDMAHFLGLFTGFMMIFALILMIIVFPFLIRNFRLKYTIAFPPLMMAGLTIAVVVSGFVQGNMGSAAGISYFFILLALSRFFSGALNESIESQSAGTLLHVLDRNIRITFNAAIKGVVYEAGIILAGLILTGLGILLFIKPEHMPVMLILIILLWIIASFRLYSIYIGIIRNTDNPATAIEADADGQDEVNVPVNRMMAELEFAGNFINLITGDISTLEENQNHWYIDKIIDYAAIKKEINLLPALKKIRSMSDLPREIRMRTSDIIQDLELTASGLGQSAGRLRAMLLLAGERTPPVTEVLKLLRSSDNDQKILGLGIISKFRLNELLTEVCGCLEVAGIELYAENVLKNFGRDADQVLRKFYLVSSENPVVSNTILRVLGKNCNNENTEFLFSLLWSSNRRTLEKTVIDLASCCYRIRSEEKDLLVRLIKDIAGIITWNLSAGICIGTMKNRILDDAVIRENDRWMSVLFNLLSGVYGQKQVLEIKENIEAGTVQSIGHALEIIGNLCDDQVKTRLSVLFDRMPVHRKLMSLFRFYPGTIPSKEDIPALIINRDYNLLGVWIRACMLRTITGVTVNEMADSLIALLFSPELILREEAARIISRSDRVYYNEAADRIPDEMRLTFEGIIDGRASDYELLYDKVIFLKSLLTDMPEESLIPLAEELKYTDYLSPECMPEESGYILWECNSNLNECRIRISYDNVLRGLSLREENTFCYILSWTSLRDYLNRYPEHSPEILRYIDEIERRNQ